ncbi:hypothetical protein [Azospirillum sp. sgz302134]
MLTAHCPTCDADRRIDRPARPARGARRSVRERYAHPQARREEFHRATAFVECDRSRIPAASSPVHSLWSEMMNRWLPGDPAR